MPVPVEAEGAAAWIERRLAEPALGIATVLYHSVVMQYLSEEERAAFERHVAEAADRATADAPLAWLRMEPADRSTEVRLSTWPHGEERCLARAGYHGTPVKPTG